MAGAQSKRDTSVIGSLRQLGIGLPANVEPLAAWKASADPLVMLALASASKNFPQVRKRLATLLHEAISDLHDVVPSRIENAQAAAKAAQASTRKLLESVSSADWQPVAQEMQEAAVDWYETEAWATATLISMYGALTVFAFAKLESQTRQVLIGELISLFSARAVIYRLYLGEARATAFNNKLCDGARSLIQAPEFV